MHNSQCLGPSCIKRSLQLYEVYMKCFRPPQQQQEAETTTSPSETISTKRSRLTRMSTFPHSFSPSSLSSSCSSRSLKRQDTLVTMSFDRVLSKVDSSSSFIRLIRVNSETAELTMNFYSSLVYLLASCAIRNMHKIMEYNSEQVLPFLRSLLSWATLEKLLSLPTCSSYREYLPPSQKEVLLMFFDKVYSITSPKLFLNVLKDILLPDIKAVLQVFVCVCACLYSFFIITCFISVIYMYMYL